MTIACTALLIVTSCRRHEDSAQDISIVESIAPQPVRVGEAAVSVQLTDIHGNPVSHARIRVEGDMAHPGMAPVFSDARESAPGSYESPVNFNMGGDWVLLLHITLADGRKIERQMDVKGVQSR